MAQNEKTSKRVASLASKVLRSTPNKTHKSIAGSALAQAPDRAPTSLKKSGLHRIFGDT